MKNTAFKEIHENLGAKMIDFAGFNMPIQYSGLIEEHKNVRENMGVFDVSHMGEFIISGPNAYNLVEYITSNDVSKLEDGKIQYSCLPNNDGGIVDDLLVYKISTEMYMLVVNGANIDKDWEWITNKNEQFKAGLHNLSNQYSLLAVQGPKAVEALQTLTSVNLSELKFYTFEVGTFAGIHDVTISATGYTGAGGFEIYFRNENAEIIWNKIFDAGKEFNIMPCGLASRDTLRLEMGYCLYGNDIDDTTSPLEAGLGWITKFNNKFNNSDYLAKQKEEGVTKKLVAFELEGKRVARHGYDIVNKEGVKIGNVTSGTMSPSLNKSIGMGYVPKELSKADSEIFIQIRKNIIPAKVVKLPFYKG
ncbi:MAG: glycine cleavage system aminomethyltransferase GcvT [Ichthyobacteriaceae bacterium]|nr:glycine cleavage system aminomethyltransferase GcvT [Ichthyobacteriaceae bacterium]